jgi:hypothetical protein
LPLKAAKVPSHSADVLQQKERLPAILKGLVMRVNATSDPSAIAGSHVAPAAREARLGHDKVALATSETLNRALEQTPEVRSDKVAEAKTLLENGSYPPAVIIRKISALLAINFNSQDASD